MEILNLYAGIGGNRKLWPKEHHVTAVEIDPKIAAMYQKNFPNDDIFICDAHEFLLDNFNNYNFIWSSPPCPSHSTIRKICRKTNTKDQPQNKPIYPDMTLYQEILFLKGYVKNLWVVENVIPWYKPLIPAHKISRHLFWSNFVIPNIKINSDVIIQNIDKREKEIRNIVNSELGLHIFKSAFRIKQTRLI